MSGRYVQVKHSDKWGWWLAWGNETFYTDDRAMRTWESAAEAAAWLEENHPHLKLVNEYFAEIELPRIEQLPLFKQDAVARRFAGEETT